MTTRDMTDPFADIPAASSIGGGPRLYTLPEGFYPMALQGTEAGTTASTPGMAGGGNPWVELEATVTAGPFRGHRVRRRQFLTPGKGPQLHYLRGVTQILTGHGTDNRALAANGIMLNQPDPAERTAAFIAWFEQAQAKNRLDLMIQWLCVQEWSGKTAVVQLGIENGRDGRQYNRFIGFHRMDDPAHGSAWLESTEFPRQAGIHAELASQGLV